jgi:hypothetical protein
MSEETVTTETTTEAPVTTESTTTPVAVSTPQSFIDGQGNLTEGWKENYISEDLRGEAIFDRINSIHGMTKSLANLERMKGADTMVKPSDRFGDEDWDGYHKAGGWTGEAIAMDAPEGLPEGMWSEDRATGFSEVFNKFKLSPWQQAGITEAYNTDLLQQITDMGNSNETSAAELKANLLSEWGNSYTQKEHLANFTVEKGTGGDAEFKERLLQKFGNDPDFIKYNANLGSGFSESGFIPHITTAPTPADLQSQINEIMNSDAFMKAMHPEHKNVMETLARLHKEKASVNQPA